MAQNPDDGAIIRVTRSDDTGEIIVRVDYNRQYDDSSRNTLRLEAKSQGPFSGNLEGDEERIAVLAGLILQSARQRFESDNRTE